MARTKRSKVDNEKAPGPAVGSSAQPPLELPAPWVTPGAGGAFEAGDEAYGLRFLRPKFGRTDADDRLFALGYPHMVMLADEPLDWAGLAEGDTLHELYYPWRGGAWARGLVERLAPCFDDLSDSDERTTALTSAPRGTDRLIQSSSRCSEPYGEVSLYMAEALLGTTQTLEGALAVWEAEDDEFWANDYGATAPLAVPFLLLRCRPADRDRFLPRIAALHAHIREVAGESRDAEAFGFAALDPATIDAAFTQRPIGTARYLAPGDSRLARLPAELARLKPAARAQFDARIAFLGGDGVTEALAKAHDGFHSTWAVSRVEQLARLAHPAASAALHARAKKGDRLAKAWAAQS